MGAWCEAHPILTFFIVMAFLNSIPYILCAVALFTAKGDDKK